MRKNIVKIVFTFTIIFNLLNVVNAETTEKVYYTNYNNVEMTKEEYDLINSNYGDLVKYIQQIDFDAAIEDINTIQTLDEQVTYVKTTTYNDYFFGSITEEEIITEEEYQLYNTTNTSNCTVGDVCYQTSTKRLSVQGFALLESNTYTFITTNLWTTVPDFYSFDVIASRWADLNETFIMTNYYGEQLASNGTVEYGYKGGNSKYTSNGVGISMNILDNCSWNQSQKTVQGYFTGETDFYYYTTYQHATQTTNLTESKSYSFSSSGLGGVLYYSNSTIRNKYDKMQGIYLNVEPQYFV